MQTTVPAAPTQSDHRDPHDDLDILGEVVVEQRLLDSVAAIAEVLASDAREADAGGHLTERSMLALRSHGLWRMRLCRDLGGLELSICAQIKVLSALAAVDTSSAWCTMVANSSVAVLGATMPAAAVEVIFADGVPACSIVAAPGGRASRADGGHHLTGSWRLASGIHHAKWVHVAAYVDGDPSRLLTFAVPAADVEILDTWQVVGLAGTGSYDFTLTDYFLPDHLVGREANPYGQQRGARRYDLEGLDRIESYEHLAFALGVTRRCLGELRHHLAAMPSFRHTSDREVVQAQLAGAVLELQALESLTASTYARIDDAASGGEPGLAAGDAHLPRALAVWATKNALEASQLAFQRIGAAALHDPNIHEKLLRDMSVAATHAMVDDVATASYGQHLIETAGSIGASLTREGARHAS